MKSKCFVGDVPVGGEVSGFVVAAAANGEAQAIGLRAGCRRRSGSPGLADFAAGAKAIPVVTAGFETRRLDVHAVAKLGTRELRTVPDDLRELAVGGDFPPDLDVGHRHAAAVERIRREPRPENDAVRQRIAGRDPERKRVRREDRLLDRPRRYDGPCQSRESGRARDLQHLPPCQAADARGRTLAMDPCARLYSS